MAKYPGLMRRGARFYLRVKVPVDLHSTLGRQIWKALGTSEQTAHAALELCGPDLSEAMATRF